MPISTPDKIITPWATSGLKDDIPENADPINGRAGFDLGFPPINLTPKTAGGIPPFGQDFNGIFFDVTQAIQFLQAGGSFPYDGAWATLVGGYPIGALVSRTDNQGLWRNTVANNLTDPEAGGAGWQPEGSGATTVAMSSSNVTLTPLQASAGIIIITGTLTANLQLIFPGYVKQWLIVNNATGAFTVTAKTSAGSGVSIPTSTRTQVYGNGSDIFSATSGAASTDGIAGAASNLKSSATGVSAVVTVTADSVCLKNVGNQQVVVNSVSVTPSLSASGANGLDAGVSSANTWYSVWVIWNGTTTAGLFSLSATNPTLPSGYTHKARVGWARSDGTANKYPLSFTQFGKRVAYKVASGSNTTSLRLMASGLQGSVTVPTWVSVAVADFVPPTAGSITVLHNSVGGTTLFAPNNFMGATGSLTNPSFGFGTSTDTVIQSTVNLESGNVYYASNANNGRLWCYGWEDNL